MKVLVTGGLGNLGSWVTRALVENGHHVTTFSRQDRPILADFRFERLFGDLRKIEDLTMLGAGRPWDAVVHLASASDVVSSDTAKESLLINALGTRNLLDVLYSNDEVPRTHFIYFSTFHVYGRTSGRITEDATSLDPKSDYASTHLFAEYYVKQFHYSRQVPFTIFRLTNGYGAPLDRTSTKWHLVLNDLCRMALQNQQITLRGDGSAQRDFIWFGDVCEVLEKTLSAGPANRIFNLGSGDSISTGELAGIVRDTYLKSYGKDVEVIKTTAVSGGEDQNLAVSINELQDWIDFNPEDRIRDEVRKVFALLHVEGQSSGGSNAKS